MGCVPQSISVRRCDAGSALLTGAVVVALAGALAVAVATVGARAVVASRAQAAADAAALAGAVAGEAAAGRVAAANGARLVSFRRVGTDVEVVIELSGVRGSARAGTGPRRPRRPGARPRAPARFSILASWESRTSAAPIRVGPGCGPRGAADA